MYEFDVEFSFPNCEHKQKLKLTSKSKKGIEKVYQKTIEERNGLCMSCYLKTK